MPIRIGIIYVIMVMVWEWNSVRQKSEISVDFRFVVS